ncbi:MAG: hypothetical protein HYV45_01780 [Candidatus Moranbacteria bacterium]|nr:hypothetical protein [Candidatus Moranbacteria bacterium]
MKIFFDFDDFFLRTENDLVKDFFQFLASLTGATEEEIFQTYKRFSGAHFSKGIPYSFEQHIEFLLNVRSFDSKNVKEKARVFFVDLKKYVFEGTVDFLKNFRKEDIYLLTYGEDSFQNLKVDGSGLRKFFCDVIVVQGSKPEVIEQRVARDHFLSDETVVFADNRCGHFTGARERGIVTIHLRRSTDKYSKDPCEGCRYRVENFDELLQVLKNI